MKVILRETIDKLGQMGETVTVKDGYARNFLIPQNLAYPATDKFLNEIRFEVERKRKVLEQQKTAAELQAKELEPVTLTFEVNVGEEDKMFGSVTSAMIASRLHESGYEIDRRKIQLDEPLKELGIFHVQIKLHPEVMAEIKVKIDRTHTEEAEIEEDAEALLKPVDEDVEAAIAESHESDTAEAPAEEAEADIDEDTTDADASEDETTPEKTDA